MTDTRNSVPKRALKDRLADMASTVEMGDRIAFGSDARLMREAASRIEALEAESARLRKELLAERALTEAAHAVAMEAELKNAALRNGEGG